MKKIEASLIKRLLRISWQAFGWFKFFLTLMALILFFLYLILLDTYSFLGALLEDYGILWIWRKKEKEMAKSLERQKCIFGKFVYENKGN